jgi:4-amino-4-deoxy-L-arabinose transferase-like glycosyltransferase
MHLSSAIESAIVRRHGLGARIDVASAFGLVLAACATLAIGAVTITGVLRLSYPWPLSAGDPASLEEVHRILSRQALYVAPTLQHVPFIYGPVYYYVSALLSLPVGLSYLPLRLLSLSASLGTLALVAYLVWRETNRPLAALATSGLLAASAAQSSTFDFAHVDALFVFFIVAALGVARTRSDLPSIAASGVLLGLAGLSKLPIGVVPIGAALALYLAVTVRWRSAAFVLGLFGSTAIVLLVLRAQSGPWPTWYLLDLPSKHEINNHGDALPYIWFRDILPRFTLPLVIGPVFLLRRFSERDRKSLLFYGLAIMSLVAVSWASRSNSGSAQNVLLPAHIGVALLFGLGLDALLRTFSGGCVQARGHGAYVMGLCILQFVLLAYNPRLLVPYRSDEWAAERLSSALTSLDGGLFAAGLDGYVRGSDKGEQPNIGAILELMGSFGGTGTAEGHQWRSDFASALRERRFAHVVVNEHCCGIDEELKNADYVSIGSIFPPNDEYWLWTGLYTPTDFEVFVPAEAEP